MFCGRVLTVMPCSCCSRLTSNCMFATAHRVLQAVCVGDVSSSLCSWVDRVWPNSQRRSSSRHRYRTWSPVAGTGMCVPLTHRKRFQPSRMAGFARL